jgi:hypothetical protein
MRILIFFDSFSKHRSTVKGSMVRHTLRMLTRLVSAGDGNLEKDIRILAACGHRSMSREYPQLKPCMIRPLKDTSTVIPGMILRQKNQKGFLRKEILDYSNKSDPYIVYLTWAKQQFDYQVLVCLSDSKVVQQFARTAGIPCIALRQGYSSPDLYDSVVFALDCEEPQYFPGDLLPIAALQRLLPVNLFESTLSPLTSRHAESIYRTAGRNVLIAFGKDVDDYRECRVSMEDVWDTVLPVLTKAGYVCYILSSGSSRVNPMSHREWEEARHLCETYKNVTWLSGIRSNLDRLRLIAKMDVVVSRYSSSGYDAILMGKPVVLLESLPWQAPGNALSIQDLLREGFRPSHLHQCREQSLCMANLLLRRILIPKELAFERSFFMERVEKLCVQAGVALGGEGTLIQQGLPKLIPEDFDWIRQQMTESYLLNHSGMLKVFGRHRQITNSPKLDRMRRKGRKLIRDPLKFLLDSQYIGLKTVGALLEKI